VGAGLLFIVLSARLAQVAQSDAYASVAVDNALSSRHVPAPRGRILDIHGTVIADAHPALDLVIVPDEVRDAASLEVQLGVLVGIDARDRAHRALERGGNAPVLLARDLKPDALARVMGHKQHLLGTRVRSSQRRTYLHGNTASHLLGYLAESNVDDWAAGTAPGELVGRTGIEGRFEADLRGMPGESFRLIDSSGAPATGRGSWSQRLTTSAKEHHQPARAGSDVVLTLDMRIQLAAERAFAGNTGAAVLLDAHTGAVLAWVSGPDFDPDELAGGVPAERWMELGRSGVLIDRTHRSVRNPAEILDLVTAASALDNGVPPDFTVRCREHGHVDLWQSLALTCDSWTDAVGGDLGPQLLHTTAQQLGFGQATGVAVLAEQPGRAPQPGQTALATPLQLAVMTAAIANGGDRPTPWLVDRTINLDGIETPTERGPATATHLHPDVLAQLRGGMRTMSPAIAVDESGKVSADGQLYVAFAPSDAPEVALAVVTQSPGTAEPIGSAVLTAWQETR